MNNLISAKNLYKKYSNITAVDIDEININEGDRIGIVGPNGAGKTTLCEMLVDIRKSSSQSTKIIHKDNLRIGMQLQESYFIKGVTGWSLIKLYIETYSIKISSEKLNELISNLQLWPVIKKSINSLSGGQKQKLNILLSIIINPDLIILDELSTGLDVFAKDSVFNLLQKFLINDKRKALILISHNMDEIAEFTDEIWFLFQGKIMQKVRTKQILEEYGNLENYLRKYFKEYNEYTRTNSITQNSSSNSNDRWMKKLDKNSKNESDEKIND